MRAILEHRNGGKKPSQESVAVAVREIAYDWEDGFDWTVYSGELGRLGL